MYNTTRRKFINQMGMTAIGFAGSSLLFPLLQGCNTSVRKPLNIVFILADDFGWNQAGYHKVTDFYETPNIDRIAREGMYFTDAYSASPVCSPARASIMTGKNPARLHLTDYIPGGLFPHEKLTVPKMEPYLPLEEKLLPEYLQDQGYVCGHFGKWHLQPDRLFDEPGRFHDPQYRGFDDVLHIAKPERDHDPYDDPHSVEAITQRSLRFLENNKDNPFFLYIPHSVVHRPLIEEAKLIEKYNNKPDVENPINNPVMGAMIERMDKGIGRILDKIDRLGIRENTVVIFASCNGGLLECPVWGKKSSQYPLRGGKAMLFEGGIRVPFCIRWPGVIEPGTKCTALVIWDDFLPTILDMVGYRPDMQERDGMNLTPLLEGADSLDRDALYWHYPHYHHLGYKPSGAIRMGDYKLIEWYEETLWGLPDQVSLYNLKEDIGETNDLSRVLPELAVEMRSRLHRWRRSVNAQEMRRNPHYDPQRADHRLGAM